MKEITVVFNFGSFLVTHRPPISQPMTFLILRPGLLVQGLAVAPGLIINLTHFGWRVFDLKGRSVGWPGWLGQIWILNIQTYSLINWLKFNTYLTTHEYEGLSLPDIDSGAFWKRYFLIQVLLFWTLGLRQNKALTSLLRWESWWGGGRRPAWWRRSHWWLWLLFSGENPGEEGVGDQLDENDHDDSFEGGGGVRRHLHREEVTPPWMFQWWVEGPT